MAHDIIDNRVERFVDHIKRILPAAEKGFWTGPCN